MSMRNQERKMPNTKRKKFDPIEILRSHGIEIQHFHLECGCLNGGFKITCPKKRGYAEWPYDVFQKISWFKHTSFSGSHIELTGGFSIDLSKTPAAFRKLVECTYDAMTTAQEKHRTNKRLCCNFAEAAYATAYKGESERLGVDQLQKKKVDLEISFYRILCHQK